MPKPLSQEDRELIFGESKRKLAQAKAWASKLSHEEQQHLTILIAANLIEVADKLPGWTGPNPLEKKFAKKKSCRNIKTR